jgi:hypothetical protein
MEFSDEHQSMLEAMSRSVVQNQSSQGRIDSDSDGEASQGKGSNEEDDMKIVSLAELLNEGSVGEQSDASITVGKPQTLDVQPVEAKKVTVDDEEDESLASSSFDSFGEGSAGAAGRGRDAILFETGAIPFRERRNFTPVRTTTVSFMNYVEARRTQVDLNPGNNRRFSLHSGSQASSSSFIKSQSGEIPTGTESESAVDVNNVVVDSAEKAKSKFLEYMSHGASVQSNNRLVESSLESQELNRIKSSPQSTKKNLAFEIESRMDDEIFSENNGSSVHSGSFYDYSVSQNGSSVGFLQVQGKTISGTGMSRKSKRHTTSNPANGLSHSQSEDHLKPFLLKLDSGSNQETRLTTHSKTSINSDSLILGGQMDASIETDSHLQMQTGVSGSNSVHDDKEDDEQSRGLRLKSPTYLNTQNAEQLYRDNLKKKKRGGKNKQVVNIPTTNFLMVSNSATNKIVAKDGKTLNLPDGPLFSVDMNDFEKNLAHQDGKSQYSDLQSLQTIESDEAVRMNYKRKFGNNLAINHSNDPLHPQIVQGYLHAQQLQSDRLSDETFGYSNSQELLGNLETFLAKSREEKYRPTLLSPSNGQRRYSSLIPKREETLTKTIPFDQTDENFEKKSTQKSLTQKSLSPQRKALASSTGHSHQLSHLRLKQPARLSRSNKQERDFVAKSSEVIQVKPVSLKPRKRPQTTSVEIGQEPPSVRGESAFCDDGVEDLAISTAPSMFNSIGTPQAVAELPSLNGAVEDQEQLSLDHQNELMEPVKNQIQELPSKASLNDSLFSDVVTPSVSVAPSPHHFSKEQRQKKPIQFNDSFSGNGSFNFSFAKKDNCIKPLESSTKRLEQGIAANDKTSTVPFFSTELNQTENDPGNDLHKKQPDLGQLTVDTMFQQSNTENALKIHDIYQTPCLKPSEEMLLSNRRRQFEYSYQYSDTVSFQKKSFRNLQLPSKSPILSPTIPATSSLIIAVGSDPTTQVVQKNSTRRRLLPIQHSTRQEDNESTNNINSPLESPLERATSLYNNSLVAPKPSNFSSHELLPPPGFIFGSSQAFPAMQNNVAFPIKNTTHSRQSAPWQTSFAGSAAATNNLVKTESVNHYLLNEVLQKDNLFNRSDKIQIWKDKLEYMRLTGGFNPVKNQLAVRHQMKNRHAFEEYAQSIPDLQIK